MRYILSSIIILNLCNKIVVCDGFSVVFFSVSFLSVSYKITIWTHTHEYIFLCVEINIGVDSNIQFTSVQYHSHITLTFLFVIFIRSIVEVQSKYLTVTDITFYNIYDIDFLLDTNWCLMITCDFRNRAGCCYYYGSSSFLCFYHSLYSN